MPSSSTVLWIPVVAADGSAWPVITTAMLTSGPDVDRVQLWNRHGALAGDFTLPAGDGAAFLTRLGMQVSS